MPRPQLRVCGPIVERRTAVLGAFTFGTRVGNRAFVRCLTHGYIGEYSIEYSAVYKRPRRRQSRSEATHRALKRRLLIGEFPFGHRLGEERLAAMLEVSRTPVREALARLHAEGHVQRHPEGGFEPAFPDMDRIAELYEVRKSLELTAIRRNVGPSSGPRQRRRPADDARSFGAARAAS